MWHQSSVVHVDYGCTSAILAGIVPGCIVP